MSKGRIFLFGVFFVATLLFVGVARGGLGNIDYWNYSYDEGEGQEVRVTEKDPSGEYNRGEERKLRIYGWGYNSDPNLHALSPVGITPNKFYLITFFLEVGTNMPNNRNNCIDINWNGPEGGDSNYTPFDCNERNFFMRQHPDSPSSHVDANVYDLLDLTNGFTENAQIQLPDITSSTPRSPNIYDKWQKIISNYADLHPLVFDGNLPDGLVNFADFAVLANYWKRSDCNESNNWCKCADLNRNGSVDYNDVSKFREQWLVDVNSIR